MGFAVFDTLLDSVIAINSENEVIYFNEAILALCDLPRRKIKPKTKCVDVIKFSDDDVLGMEKGTWGKDEATAYRELDFTSGSGRQGRVQLSVQPYAEEGKPPSAWLFFMRDVTLEQALHKKYKTELAEKESAFLKLEDYSKNLEKMVEARTAEIRAINALLAAMLDSLGQAFLIFDSTGTCLSVHSRACETVLAIDPSGKPISEILRLDADQAASFEKLRENLFAEPIPFEDLIELAPKKFSHPTGKHVRLEYHGVRAEDGHLEKIILVGTDFTAEYEANLVAERERAYVKMVIYLVKQRDQFLEFIRETLKNLDSLKGERFDTQSALRVFHTIKGTSAMFSMNVVAESAHEAEEVLLKSTEKDQGFAQVNKIEGKIKEFFINNREIIGRELGDFDQRMEVPARALLDFLEEIRKAPDQKSLEAVFTDQMIKEPVEKTLTHYNEVITSLSKSLKKEVKPLEFKGGDTRVYRRAYADLFSTFVHAFRNSLDHGVEDPEERKGLGKDAAATLQIDVSLEYRHDANWLKICISDDGRGINLEALRKKIEATDKSKYTDDQILQKVFDSGVSTRTEVTELSGRGVGMGAILEAAKKIGGGARIYSETGKGTRLMVLVPNLAP